MAAAWDNEVTREFPPLEEMSSVQDLQDRVVELETKVKELTKIVRATHALMRSN